MSEYIYPYVIRNQHIEIYPMSILNTSKPAEKNGLSHKILVFEVQGNVVPKYVAWRMCLAFLGWSIETIPSMIGCSLPEL
jgi:hypothetical protein